MKSSLEEVDFNTTKRVNTDGWRNERLGVDYGAELGREERRGRELIEFIADCVLPDIQGIAHARRTRGPILATFKQDTHQSSIGEHVDQR